MLKWLQTYLELGFPLFPYGQPSKKPLNRHGYSLKYLEAGGPTLRMEQVKAWYEQYPGCAWGMATTDERGVLDIDPRHGGDRILAEWQPKHGKLPPTWTVATGGGGWHKYFQFPSGTRSRELEGNAIGIKAIDGGVILPPSRLTVPGHQGRAYKWEMKPWELDIGVAPAWLVEKFQQKPKPTSNDKPNADEWVVQAPALDLLTHPGASKSKGEQRRPTLARLVGVHLARGDSKASIEAMARAWASRCEPPLTEEEWRKHVDGLWDKQEGQRHDHYTPLPLPPHHAPAPASELTKGQSDGETGANGELVRSLATPHEHHQGEGKGGVRQSPETYPYPVLSSVARYGLLGKMVGAIAPHTEADPAGILLDMLACFGSVVGRGASFDVNGDAHYPNLFVGIVGEVSAGKRQAWKRAVRPFAEADEQWARDCVLEGIGSGEGLIEQVMDEQVITTVNKAGVVEQERVPGATDKRCLVRLEEMSRAFKQTRRDGSMLGPILLQAWDGSKLDTGNKRQNRLYATEHAISSVCDIQPLNLTHLMAKGEERFNGGADRFLWCCVYGGPTQDLRKKPNVYAPFIEPLLHALAFGKQSGELSMDEEANALWESVMDDLRFADGVYMGKLRAHTIRMAMIYALTDRSVLIRKPHLEASLAVADYCRQSARLLFAEKPVPDPLWLKVLNLIVAQPGINRRSIHEAFGGRLHKDKLTEALDHLLATGLAYRQTVQSGGRPAECWFPAKREPGDGQRTPPSSP